MMTDHINTPGWQAEPIEPPPPPEEKPPMTPGNLAALIALVAGSWGFIALVFGARP